MLLRRVIEHFRKQEWTAIGIDFVIVVVGVFIGIQVANWNEARADHARARAYLERIGDDLQADIANYDDRLQFWGAVSTYGRTGLSYAETRNAGDQTQWQLLLAYFQASQLAEYFTTDTTYAELRSAGELGLIPNLELRNALASYYTNAAIPVLTERPPYRVSVREAVPFDVQLYIWDNCYGTSQTGGQVLLDRASPISNERATTIVNAISRDERIVGQLRYWMSTMHVAAIIGGERVGVARSMLGLINEELGRADEPAP